MPYYITDSASGCDGWATVKDDGEVMGCHTTKQAAIDQALAIALAEGSEFVGERQLPDAYRPATAEDVPEGRACGNCAFFDESDVAPDGRAMCQRWMEYVDGGFYCDAWEPREEGRQVDLSLPAYIRDAAEQGLAFHAEGLSGDGVVERTVREARLMARGEVSEDKVIRVSAWAARHEVDLEAEGARPGEDGYPTPGAVAHLLWGIPTGGRYADARAWFDRKAQQIRDEEGRMDVTPVKPRVAGSGVEFRSTTFELRAEGNTFVGYAAMFNAPSQPLPFTERIAPGAFDRSLRNRRRDIRLYVNHNSDLVLASKRSGTLRLEEDSRGLRVEADLPDTSYANDLRALMSAGVVDKMSFGFTVPRGGDSWSEDGRERTLREVALHEVSVVTGFPAYEQTQAAVRSLEALSARTGMAVDELTEALDALADGQELDPAKADLLISAIKTATPTPEPAPVNLLGLKSKQAELLAKKVF